jgi:uncharacterized surface protein with fasciclin (FAS1) repeats
MFRHRTSARPNAVRRAKAVMVAAALVASLAACGSDNGDPSNDAGEVIDAGEVAGAADSLVDEAETVDSTSADLADTLRANGLESIAGIVDQVDMTEVLGDEFTFFAPNDEAFTTLGADQTADLLTDPARILDVLRNHTLADTVTSSELAGMETVETEAGETIPVTTDGDVVKFGDVTVVTTDLEVGGGIVHVVDGFLIP